MNIGTVPKCLYFEYDFESALMSRECIIFSNYFSNLSRSKVSKQNNASNCNDWNVIHLYPLLFFFITPAPS